MGPKTNCDVSSESKPNYDKWLKHNYYLMKLMSAYTCHCSCNHGNHSQCDEGHKTAVTMETIARVMVGVQTAVTMVTIASVIMRDTDSCNHGDHSQCDGGDSENCNHGDYSQCDGGWGHREL